MTPSFADRIAGGLIAHRGILALVALVLAVVSVERSRRLEFSRSIDTMFDRSDPALAPYARMTRTFGSNEVVLAAYDDPDLFTAAGISRLRSLATELESLAGVASVTSLASTPLGDRIIDLDDGLTAGWARRLVSLLEGYVVGSDHRTACVACVLEPHATNVATPRAQAVSRAGTIDPAVVCSPAPCSWRASAACDGSSCRSSWCCSPCGAPAACSPSQVSN